MQVDELQAAKTVSSISPGVSCLPLEIYLDWHQLVMEVDGSVQVEEQ